MKKRTQLWIAAVLTAFTLAGVYTPKPLAQAQDLGAGFGSTPKGIVGLTAFRGCKTDEARSAAVLDHIRRERVGFRIGQATGCNVLSMQTVPQTITTVGKAYIVDGWRGAATIGNMKYHGIGTGTTAASASDTSLETELTTQYNPNSTRATGSLVVGASSNILQSVGTNTVDATVAITEWGFLSQAATGGGVLFSRVVFSAVNLSSGDSLQTTYNLTFN